MSDDLQFGELETKEPDRGLRPDRNRHYSVVPYGNPAERELPIYIDLDVMRDIETHAASDTTVELGGVLLGGQYHDEDGQPFVLITDSLRAEHYESTKGSFKFTHETWSAISRQRDEFPPDCQMVGWYHTHPDWGVFLSGMDMFICDNFFNKLLDVAYVVDPCRGDRGMFQWIAGPKQTTRRTGGFYVIASRFRQSELESFVTALEEGDAMPSLNDPRGNSQTVVHLHGQQPPWMGTAVLGMLLLQFLLVAVVAYKVIDSSSSQQTDKLFAKLLEEREREVHAETQTKVLDRVLSSLKGTKEGTVDIIADQEEEIREIEGKLRDQRELATDRASKLAVKTEELAHAETKAEDLDSKLKKKIADVEKHRDYLQEKSDKLAEQLKETEAALKAKAATDGPVSPRLYWVIGGGLALLVVAGVAAAFIPKPKDGEASEEEENPQGEFVPAESKESTTSERPASGPPESPPSLRSHVDHPQPIARTPQTPQ